MVCYKDTSDVAKKAEVAQKKRAVTGSCCVLSIMGVI